MVKVIPQGYGKCKSDNDRHQSNYPRVFPRDITTGDGAQAETQPHISEELPGPCGSIRQEHGVGIPEQGRPVIPGDFGAKAPRKPMIISE